MRNRKTVHSFNPVKVVIILLLIFLCLDVGLRFVIPSKQSVLNVNRPVEYQDLFIPNQFGRLKPNIDETIQLHGAAFHLKTNGFGLRSPNTKKEKPGGVKRIAVLSDSVGFGLLLEENQSYPAILREKLNQNALNYEVINFSAPGLSSVQGEYLYQTVVKPFQPDVLILSYGLYDSKWSTISDNTYLQILSSYHALQPKPFYLRFVSTYSLIGNWYSNRSFNMLMEELANHNRLNVDKKSLRVEQTTAKRALQNIIHDQKENGGDVVLLDANIENFFNQSFYHDLQNDRQIQTLSVHNVLHQSGQSNSKKIRYQKGLEYPGKQQQDDQSASVVFRAFAPNQSTLFLRIESTDGSIRQWYDMNDSGINGDEKTGDQVWSVRIQLDQPVHVYYKFYSQKPAQSQLIEGAGENEETISLAVESHVRLISLEEISIGFTTTLPLVQYGTLPHQEYRMPEHPEFPGKEIHQSIANRLYYLITAKH